MYCRTNWVRVCGTLYRVGVIVLVKMMSDMPQFGQVVDIVLHHSTKPLLVVDTLDTVRFNRHFYAYEVNEKTTRAFQVIKQEELADHHTLCAYTPQNSQQFMVPLKYYVLSDFDTE